MSHKGLVSSTPLSDFFRDASIEEKRALYLDVAQSAIESQRRVIESARKIRAEQKGASETGA
jgi:hypothetical protein